MIDTRIRKKIPKDPKDKHIYYVVDACFLINRYLPLVNKGGSDAENNIISETKKWWEVIDKQIKNGKARIYIPDISIAEAFKVLAKKKYSNWFIKAGQYKTARDKLSKDLRTPIKSIVAGKRDIKFHDISTNRDIIISVDRFHESLFKRNKNIEIPDLMILATTKYLIDFYDLPRERIFILTVDNKLWEAGKVFKKELPGIYNPAKQNMNKVFTKK